MRACMRACVRACVRNAMADLKFSANCCLRSQQQLALNLKSGMMTAATAAPVEF